MKEITLKIPDKKFRFFMELVESLGFLVVNESENMEEPYDPEFVAKVKQGDRDFAEGKGIKMSIDDFKALCK